VCTRASRSLASSNEKAGEHIGNYILDVLAE
jgi:hypothetical protein